MYKFQQAILLLKDISSIYTYFECFLIKRRAVQQMTKAHKSFSVFLYEYKQR